MKIKVTLIVLLLFTCIAIAQKEPNSNTTICWDVSASMESRDVGKELSVLEKIFQKNGNQEVQLLLFGIGVDEKNYTIIEGDWTKLKEDLENAKYDGGTVYEGLNGKIKNQNVYVFTDGKKTLPKDVLSLDGKSFIINSSPNRDAKFLERTTLLNKSRLMDFAAIHPENVKKLQQETVETETSRESRIKGTVYIDNKPAPDVRVSIKGISDSFLTGTSGEFSVPAEVGDTLVVTSRTSKTVKTVPVQIMGHTDVFMTSNLVALDEVIVVEKELEKAEMTLTGYGLQNKNAIGYTVSELDDEDILEVTTDIGDAINTKIPGLQVPGRIEGDGFVAGGLGAAQIRGVGTINMNTNALVVINGVPQKRSETSRAAGGGYTSTNANMNHIDPANIAKITVLKGLAATNAWGSEGRGGVILITTKTAVQGISEDGKPVDRALLKDNIYDAIEGELTLGESPTTMALNESATLDDAYGTYMALKNLNHDNIEFLLDAFNYFKNKDAPLAGKIISNLLEWNTGNIELLRILASSFAAVGEYDNAIRINTEIIAKAPSDVNAYLNRALANRALGNYQEALKELLALEKGSTYFSVNATGISKTLKREIKNLISKHKSKLDLTNVDSEYLNNLKYKVRLVFEWNIPGAEFELQFVNPQKRYFNWEHSNTAMKSRLENELKNNYRIEEYEFYGDVAGEWVVNAKYLGDAIDSNQAPLVLRTTIYKDFGTPTQAKEEILVHFSKPEEKKNVKKLLVN